MTVSPRKGTVRYLENKSTGGKTPRGFGIDPTGDVALIKGSLGSRMSTILDALKNGAGAK